MSEDSTLTMPILSNDQAGTPPARQQEEQVASSPSTKSQSRPPDESRKWTQKVLRQGPWNEVDDFWSTKGAPSLPMPVEVADKQSLAPFFTHLQNGGTHLPLESSKYDAQLGHEPYYTVDMIEYPKGVLYSDGRVDLCKMVVGPPSIQDLMDSLRPNTFARHFLLGNNIIGAVGAKAIASFVRDFPERFETWYLAGNCLNAASISLLVDSWIESKVITNIWLKRNPLGSGAAQDIARLITLSPRLRTLDLDQTELGDQGIADLFAALLSYETTEPYALRHLYLNATGISKLACKQISLFLASPKCKLESLYMACNPIGSAASVLAAGLRGNRSLQRLTMQSCGLQSASLSPLIESLSGHPSLRTLDLGQSFATEDLGARYNWVTDESVPLLVHLVRTTKLQNLDIGETLLTQQSLQDLTAAVAQSDTMLMFQAKTAQLTRPDAEALKANRRFAFVQTACKDRLHTNVREWYGCDYDHFMAEHRRFVISPTDVRLIDSVYRNRDAGLARRGLKLLDKHWEEGDDTALRAEMGTL